MAAKCGKIIKINTDRELLSRFEGFRINRVKCILTIWKKGLILNISGLSAIIMG